MIMGQHGERTDVRWPASGLKHAVDINDEMQNIKLFISTVPPLEVDYLVCGLCQRDFPLANMVSFIQHKKFDCDDFRDCQGSKSRILLCQSCPRKFSTPWRLVQHAQSVHSMHIYLEQGEMGSATHTHVHNIESSALGAIGDISFIDEYLQSPSKQDSTLMYHHNYSVQTDPMPTTVCSSVISSQQSQGNAQMSSHQSPGNAQTVKNTSSPTKPVLKSYTVAETQSTIAKGISSTTGNTAFVINSNTNSQHSTSTSSNGTNDFYQGSPAHANMKQEIGFSSAIAGTTNSNDNHASLGNLISDNSGYLHWVQSELEVKTNQNEVDVSGDINSGQHQEVNAANKTHEENDDDSKCCDNQACGVTVMPVTHEELKKCCNAVVPKKRKRHMETKHMTSGKSRRRSSSTGDKYSRKTTKTVYIDIEDSIEESLNSSPLKKQHHSGSSLSSAAGADYESINQDQAHSVIIQPGTMVSIPVSSSNTLPPISTYLTKPGSKTSSNLSSHLKKNQNKNLKTTIQSRDPELDAQQINSVLGFLDLAHPVGTRSSGISHHQAAEVESNKLLIQLSTENSPSSGRSFLSSPGDNSSKNQALIDDGKAFNRKRRYPTSKPFKCDQCGQAFNQRIHLRKHQSKHTGVKPFQCEQCDYSTVEKSHLKVHIRVHTGEKPYKCTYCEYATAQNSTLKIHLKRHHQGTAGVRCLQCKKEFSEPENLTTHTKTEHKAHNRQIIVQEPGTLSQNNTAIFIEPDNIPVLLSLVDSKTSSANEGSTATPARSVVHVAEIGDFKNFSSASSTTNVVSTTTVPKRLLNIAQIGDSNKNFLNFKLLTDTSKAMSDPTLLHQHSNKTGPNQSNRNIPVVALPHDTAKKVTNSALLNDMAKSVALQHDTAKNVEDQASAVPSNVIVASESDNLVMVPESLKLASNVSTSETSKLLSNVILSSPGSSNANYSTVQKGVSNIPSAASTLQNLALVPDANSNGSPNISFVSKVPSATGKNTPTSLQKVVYLRNSSNKNLFNVVLDAMNLPNAVVSNVSEEPLTQIVSILDPQEPILEKPKETAASNAGLVPDNVQQQSALGNEARSLLSVVSVAESEGLRQVSSSEEQDSNVHT